MFRMLCNVVQNVVENEPRPKRLRLHYGPERLIFQIDPTGLRTPGILAPSALHFAAFRADGLWAQFVVCYRQSEMSAVAHQ